MPAIVLFITINFLAMSELKEFNRVRDWSHAKAGVANPKGEVNAEHSLTVPNMTMSLEELLKRYTRGEQVSVFEPVFNGDEDFPDVENMDVLDRIDLLNQVKVGVNDLRDDIERKRKLPKVDPLVVTPPTPDPGPDPAASTM